MSGPGPMEGNARLTIARTLDLVGEKWALLAVREVFLGNRGFDEMIRRAGAPPLVLQHRCGHQLVTRVVCEARGEPLRARDTRPLAASG